VSQGIFKGLGVAAPWDSGTTYAANDVATLAGTSYVCRLAHTNQPPPNATYWAVLAAKGDAATVDVGATTTGASGTDAAVVNSGSSAAAILDFTIPAGKGYAATSTTSLTIGAGPKAFTTQAGLAYQNGARVRASSEADTSNWMEGLATYAGTSLTIEVNKTNGSGTLADWNLNLAGEPGTGDLSSALKVGSQSCAVAEKRKSTHDQRRAMHCSGRRRFACGYVADPRRVVLHLRDRQRRRR
jgi:hypothetical protein